MTRWVWLGLWMACQPAPTGGTCGLDLQPGRFHLVPSGTDDLADAVLTLGPTSGEVRYAGPDGEAVVVLHAPAAARLRS